MFVPAVRLLTKTGMGIQTFNKLPNIKFIEILSAVLESLHAQRQANRRTVATALRSFPSLRGAL
jgi:hypothetical protein